MTDIEKRKERIQRAKMLGWTQIQCGDAECPDHLIGLPPAKIRLVEVRSIPTLEELTKDEQ